uniref:Akirin-1 n=1 Tax=Lygus hesperus TaxID=30085 RepID=A0A0A9X4P1_LYGHE
MAENHSAMKRPFNFFGDCIDTRVRKFARKSIRGSNLGTSLGSLRNNALEIHSTSGSQRSPSTSTITRHSCTQQQDDKRSFPSMETLNATPEDEPLYTYQQLLVICMKKLEEQENQIRSEYESKLSQELALRYETFSKDSFNFANQMDCDANYLL